MFSRSRYFILICVFALSAIIGAGLVGYQSSASWFPHIEPSWVFLLILTFGLFTTLILALGIMSFFITPLKQAHQNLRKAREFETAVNGLHEIFLIVRTETPSKNQDKKFTIQNLNSSAAQLIGLPPAALVGTNLEMWFKTDFSRLASEKTPFEGELTTISGDKIPLELSANTIADSDETKNCFALIGRDSRWKKEFEKKLINRKNLLKESQSLAKIGSFRWEVSTGNSEWTEEVFHILGLPSKSTAPSSDLFISLILPEDRHVLDQNTQKARQGSRSLHFEVRMKKANTGEVIWIRCHGRPEFDAYGKPKYIIGTLQDVTEIRKNELALIAAKDEALKSSQAKSEFLARMSHEIRTPMNAIMGMADLLKETKLSPEQEYYISIFRRAGESLMTLINGILDLSKIEAGEVTVENTPFDLDKLMKDVEEIMRPKVAEKNLSFSYEIAPSVRTALIGDPFKLRQILINLVNNAVKFTARGTIRVQIVKNPTKKDSLMFSVTDTGIGIAEDKQQLIFQKFSQADSTITRRFGGTGLGLAISKSLVELLGGQIWFKSQENVGTTFFFTTPYREQVLSKAGVTPLTGVATAHPREIPRPHEKVRILLVDDTQDNRVLFTHFLKHHPYEIVEAQNGLEALNKVKSEKFDIIFMDVQMPELDGYAVTEMIRKWEKEQHLPPTPIIALTAHALSEDRQKSLSAGCDDHIAKPFKRDTLVDFINHYTL